MDESTWYKTDDITTKHLEAAGGASMDVTQYDVRCVLCGSRFSYAGEGKIPTTCPWCGLKGCGGHE